MTFFLKVIKGCPFCDEMMHVFPKMVKKYPGVSFDMRCVSETTDEDDGEVFPIVKFVHLGSHGLFTDKISGALFEKDLVGFIERSLDMVHEKEK